MNVRQGKCELGTVTTRMSQVVGNTPRLEKILFKEKALIFVKEFIEKEYNG